MFKSFVSFVFIGIGLLFFPTHAQSQQIDSLLKVGVELRESYQDIQALQVFEQILKKEPNHYESLWSAALMASWLGNRQDDKNEKKRLFLKADEYVNHCMQIDSSTYFANYVKSVVIGRIALISSTKERIGSAKRIKFYADKALAIDSTQAGAWGVLGRWHHKLMILNFAERAAANLLFGGLPEGASQEQALYCLKKAISLKPNFILYHRDYAKALNDFGHKEEAKKVAKEVLGMKGGTPEDERYIKEMKDILN